MRSIETWLILIISLVYLKWFILSVKKKTFKGLPLFCDCFQLIPVFWYFVPPPLHDVEIIYRDKIGDEQFTPWKCITPIVQRNPKNIFWNISFHLYYAFLHAFQDASSTLFYTKNSALVRSRASYQCLLHYVKQQPHHKYAQATQFALGLKDYKKNARTDSSIILYSDFADL